MNQTAKMAKKKNHMNKGSQNEPGHHLDPRNVEVRKTVKRKQTAKETAQDMRYEFKVPESSTSENLNLSEVF